MRQNPKKTQKLNLKEKVRDDLDNNGIEESFSDEDEQMDSEGEDIRSENDMDGDEDELEDSDSQASYSPDETDGNIPKGK